jgi:hypothetical protein
MPAVLKDNPVLTINAPAAIIRCSKQHVSHVLAGKIPGIPRLTHIATDRRKLAKRSRKAESAATGTHLGPLPRACHPALRFVSATDTDKDGRQLAEVVAQAFDLFGRTDLRFRIEEPQGVKDWSDVFRARRQPSPLAPGPAETRPA